jgi:endonuclease YncB( thermonuclease family)
MTKFPLTVLLLVFSALLFSQQLTPDVIQGKVVGITDGDTLTILMDSKQYKIRLAEIDTPERNQPYGSKAKDVLSNLVFGKEAVAKVQDIDRYGRYVARIYAGELDVSREMVRQGAAWVYRQYLRDKSFLDVEAEAKEAKRGLWSLPEAQNIPPWEWRRGGR